MDKKTIFILCLAIFIFSLRLANIGEAIYDDEANFAYSLTVMDEYGFNSDFPSPQFFHLLYKPLVFFFGLETWVFRIVPWIFGIFNTILIYFLAKRNFGVAAARWSTVLMLISFYPTLASLQFDVEGSMVTFFILLLFFSYLEYRRSAVSMREASIKEISSPSAHLSLMKKPLFWQIIAGLSLGFAVTVKYNSIYIVAPLILMAFIDHHGLIKKVMKDLFLICFIGALVFFAYLVLGMLILPDQGSGAIHFFSWYTGFAEKYRPEGVSVLGVGMFLLWATPLFAGLFALALFTERKSARPFILWVGAAMIFYSLFLTYGAMDRYFMNTIPALAIIGGICLQRLQFRKREILFGGVIGMMLLGLLFFINSLAVKYIPRFPELYAQELLQGNAQFLFSFTSSSGPMFGVSFATILFSFLVGGYALVWLLWSRLAKNKRKGGLNYLSCLSLHRGSRMALVLFLSMGMAFNIFLVTEYLFHPTTPDVSDVVHTMLSEVKEKNLPYPIYVSDSGMMWYLNHEYWREKYDLTHSRVLGIPDNELGEDTSFVEQKIAAEGGTLLLLHWPPLHEDSPARKVALLCSKEKSFFSRGKLVGERYDCG